IAFLRRGVQEPECWRKKIATSGGWPARESFAALFSREYRKRTGFNCLFLLISMVGLWAASVYAPGAVTEVARRSGYDSVQSARLRYLRWQICGCGGNAPRGSGRFAVRKHRRARGFDLRRVCCGSFCRAVRCRDKGEPAPAMKLLPN